jgi:hypothetical protein
MMKLSDPRLAKKSAPKKRIPLFQKSLVSFFKVIFPLCTPISSSMYAQDSLSGYDASDKQDQIHASDSARPAIPSTVADPLNRTTEHPGPHETNANNSAYFEKNSIKIGKRPSFLKRIAQKMSGRKEKSQMRGQTIPKGDVTMVVIKGGDIQVELEGKDSDNFDLQTTGTAVLSKKRTCLIVSEGSDGALHGKITVPNGVRVVLEGGFVKAGIAHLIAEMEISGGSIDIAGHGKISRMQVRAGQAKMNVQGLMGQTDIYCGHGDINLTYVPESFEKIDSLEIPEPITGKRLGRSEENPYISSGLRLHQPSVRIKVHLAHGHSTFFFPPNTGVSYPKEAVGLFSFVRHQSKRAPFRIFPYTVSSSASITLRSIGDPLDAKEALSGSQP